MSATAGARPAPGGSGELVGNDRLLAGLVLG